MGLTLAVFHADHMLRGEESAGDAEFVREMAEGLGLPSRSVRIDVKREIEETGRSPQDAARALRLEALLDYATSGRRTASRWGTPPTIRWRRS